jgi:methionyl-tRNA formyltransferase
VIVFFGMNGGFSTATLAALASHDLRPSLIIHGFAKTPSMSELYEVRSTKPSLLERVGVKRPAVPPTLIDGELETDLTRAAERLDVDVIRTTDANRARARARISAAEPEALIVAGFPHLLSKDVLSLSKRGGLNLHPGKLPEERGPSPLFWTLKAGRTELAYTVHMLDEGEDSGDIVRTGKMSFDPGTDGEEILTRCAKQAAPELIRATRSLLQGDIVRAPQSKERLGRCPRPTFRDGMIDVAKSALEVFTFVSGCARTHSIFAECGGDRFFIERALSYDMEAKMAFEMALTGDHLLLRCNPGIVELQLKEQGALFSAEY